MRLNTPPEQAWKLLKTLDGRLPMWADVMHMLREHLLTGIGLGNFPLIIANYSEYRWMETAHNTYLQVYADTGLLGGLAIVVAAILYLKLLRDIKGASNTDPAYALTLGVAAAVFAVAFYGLYETSPVGYYIRVEGVRFYSLSPLLWVFGGGLVWSYRRLMGKNCYNK
jgi:hypothetical protein